MKVKNIGIFGGCNVGKSSLANILAGQDIAIVSAEKGTTTDPVRKRVEIFGIGPCNIIDTAGFDDDSELGILRVRRSLAVAEQVDMAILVFTDNYFAKREKEMLEFFNKLSLPVLLVHNKSDIEPLDDNVAQELNSMYGVDVVEFSCTSGADDRQEELQMLTCMIVKVLSQAEKYEEKPILDGFVQKGDLILLVCPVDSQAPEKRLILPQVMAVRDILDNGGEAAVVQPGQLQDYIAKVKDISDIKLAVTDSQVFEQVDKMLPKEIPLTSFSILMARSKGPFGKYLDGLKQIDKLGDGDRILVLESCAHHITCDDIGRVKIPKRLKKYLADLNGGTEPALEFDFVQGLDEIEICKEYALAIQCGGCMVTKRQLLNRVNRLIEKNIPVVNYGMLLAYLNGIMERIVYEP